MCKTRRYIGEFFLTILAVIWLSSASNYVYADGPHADAVVLVNSSSPKYLDYLDYLQPYLDNFGVPYTVVDIAGNSIPLGIGRHALIIIGHGQLDPSQTLLTAAAQSNIINAVSLGAGLVNFDNALTNGVGTNGFPYVQTLFGFGYTSSSTGANITFPATLPANQMHFITSRHTTNDLLKLTNTMTLPGLTYGTNVTAIVLSSGQPLVTIAKYGLGRVVQFSSTDWIKVAVLGPVNGMDDVLWRSFVWAARKPFVMRSIPNFATMRVDDVAGPFNWVHTVNQVGFKPFIAIFFQSIANGNIPDLRSIVTNGNATTSIHSFTDSDFFYYDDANATAYSDSVMSNNFVLGTQWHTNNGIPISKMMIAHWSEMGVNAFAGLKAWGIQYVLIEVQPGTREYYSPFPTWLPLGPYRNYDTLLQGQALNPMAYADWLVVPGHPEFSNTFFNPYTEIRNVLPSPAYNFTDGGDWEPDPSDITGSIYRGTQQIKRGFDSLTLGNVFTHERYINQVPNTSWLTILQGVTNNLAPYKPAYVTMDYGNQYVRALKTSHLTTAVSDVTTGNINVGVSGNTDLIMTAQVYTGADSAITNSLATIPIFTGTTNIVAANVGASPLPKIRATLQGNQVMLSFNTVPWQDYTVSYCSDLRNDVWSVLTNITAVGTNTICSDLVDDWKGYYRASLNSTPSQ